MNLLPASEWAPDKEGCFIDLPAETYHAAPAFNHSMAKNMNPPARLPVYLKRKREPSPAMIMGTLVHHMTLEPDRPLPQLAIKPEDMKFSTTEGKAWRAEALKSGRMIVTASDWESVQGMVNRVAANPACRKIFSNGWSEVSCFARDQQTGVMKKMRIDWLTKAPANFIADIKTCQEGKASNDEFGKVLYDLRYYSQAAWYLDIWNQLNPDDIRQHFLFIAVEKVEPYLENILPIAQDAIEAGREQNALDFATYCECVKSGYWPGYNYEEFKEVNIPEYARKTVIKKRHDRWLAGVARSMGEASA